MTSLIFFSFSAFSLLTSNRTFIYFGVSIALSILSIIHIFVWNGKMEVIIGIILAVGYIIVDTQHIIFKCNPYNDNDCLMDAKMLFVDFANIFVKILIYLLKEKDKEKEKKEE